ncbi:class I SAM-dependent methyltransferase [Stackebrandtia nassauensis]|nr:class I SAM-dependent methyltransferase [Stackebrandtia nassauensis]
MEWVEGFYSTTGKWWADAESDVSDRDRDRAASLSRWLGPERGRVLELGSGYGNTAAAIAQAGHEVIGVEISDRIDAASRHAAPDSPRFVQADFYGVELPGRFDAVCYFNGFGIGTDADQRRLLRRIASEWLTGNGVALIDVFNPFVWASWDGDEELLRARPEAGYRHELRQLNRFDPVNGRAVDTWWRTDEPQRGFTQDLRCYTPADLRLLLEGTGLRLSAVVVGDEELDLAKPHVSHQPLLTDRHEYLAVLRPDGS